jgi:uncharacterized protein
MTPKYFGTRKHLFGVCHLPPESGRTRQAAVVICYPFGQDYLYALRTFRVLAMRLARQGFAVLRFDYTGTGDSSGEIGDVSVDQWVSDVADAVAEVRSQRHVTIYMVGSGLGAALATKAAANLADVNRLVLWNPVIDGAHYLAALSRRHAIWVAELEQQLPSSRDLVTAEDLLGSRLTARLRADFESFSVGSIAARPADDILLLCTEQPDRCAEFGRRLQSLGANVEVSDIQDEKLASMVPGQALGVVQSRSIAQIEQWLKAGSDV